MMIGKLHKTDPISKMKGKGKVSNWICLVSECRSGTSSRQPDVCVKLLLLTHTGQELGRAKTSLKKSQQAPTFLELFMFQVP